MHYGWVEVHLTERAAHSLELELTRFDGHPEDGFGGVLWEDFGGRIRLSSGGSWWSWCAQDAHRRSHRGSLSRRRAQSIWNWVRQADRDAGKRTDGPTSVEREELTKLRRENARLRQERDILAKAAARFARESKATPSGFTGS